MSLKSTTKQASCMMQLSVLATYNLMMLGCPKIPTTHPTVLYLCEAVECISLYRTVTMVIPCFCMEYLGFFAACAVTTIKQEDIIQEILKAKPDLDRQAIFDNDYLDFEAAYEAKGWRVTYDKPGYNETYPASFLFVGKP
jgi:hypothetical protein